MRLILGLILLAVLALAVAPVVYYGTADPCRMLAADMAHEAYGPLAELVGNDPDKVPESMERSMRMVTSQMSSRDCAEKLWQRWTETR
ncbi:hypothetical protein Plav_0865 [Parvibaculum lavamentivorans DS-1]|uniref:Uncharacterized protein n=1 Tax=Parvibaculum lavamentivorans (strain DS-1 / DSM 13023 / NCIMB 13966) TaxID=402881 RepID=A7HRF5_PARL1|nr:hypothetical protein [Parvibaculum lavamentivorans]ABS62488.1 hypothetical protein Plav_0865 [Parvibaculum lavamentivorans DS-1]